MLPPEPAAAILSAAAALGIALDPAALDRLLGYLALLQRWNSTYNLTAVRDPAQMLTQHLADCMAAVPPLRRHVGDAEATVLDVGSGGGLPGVVIAALDPGTVVTCVDTVGKKAAFVRQVAAELKLANLQSVHARVEQLDNRFDVVTSRAFATLGDFCRLTRTTLADRGGVWMAMKGKLPHDEIAALPNTVEVFHVERLTVPGLKAERCVVWMRPTA